MTAEAYTGSFPLHSGVVGGQGGNGTRKYRESGVWGTSWGQLPWKGCQRKGNYKGLGWSFLSAVKCPLYLVSVLNSINLSHTHTILLSSPWILWIMQLIMFLFTGCREAPKQKFGFKAYIWRNNYAPGFILLLLTLFLSFTNFPQFFFFFLFRLVIRKHLYSV